METGLLKACEAMPTPSSYSGEMCRASKVTPGYDFYRGEWDAEVGINPVARSENTRGTREGLIALRRLS